MTTSTTGTGTPALTAEPDVPTTRHDYADGTTVIGTEKNTRARLLRSSRYHRPKHGDIDLVERTPTGPGYTVARAIDEAMHTGSRHHPVTAGNRIGQRVAERRAVRRRLGGHGALETYVDEHGRPGEQSVAGSPQGQVRERVLADAVESDEKIAYRRNLYAALQAEGRASTAGEGTVVTGDWMSVRGRGYRVRRVDTGTVGVVNHLTAAPEPGGPEHTDTTPRREVREHRTGQMPTGLVEAHEPPGTDRLRLHPADFRDAGHGDGRSPGNGEGDAGPGDSGGPA
ncbi:hypothetical protein [Saccharothrix syringae]|uniref:Uncharacterized protein n=1 Tax=Saccharothrix syringae TaxID=103733 RepID=A0A5Q0H2T8_SACSY|nr:hypothetical protein [Saccharothrix syringae]QFZ20518.1 hypothetical protein EKG83_26700 [Saccharothrix syringae]